MLAYTDSCTNAANRRQSTHGPNPRLLTPQKSTRAYFSHSLERLCNDPAPDGFFKGPGVAKRYCTTNSIGDSFPQRRPGTVPFPPVYGPLALELGHWDGGSQRRCKWLLCGLRFTVSYASTGATSRLDSPMLPRQDPKGTDALWGSMQVRLERSLVECGARRPGTSLRTEIRSRIPTPTGD